MSLPRFFIRQMRTVNHHCGRNLTNWYNTRFVKSSSENAKSVSPGGLRGWRTISETCKRLNSPYIYRCLHGSTWKGNATTKWRQEAVLDEHLEKPEDRACEICLSPSAALMMRGQPGWNPYIVEGMQSGSRRDIHHTSLKQDFLFLGFVTNVGLSILV